MQLSLQFLTEMFFDWFLKLFYCLFSVVFFVFNAKLLLTTDDCAGATALSSNRKHKDDTTRLLRVFANSIEDCVITLATTRPLFETSTMRSAKCIHCAGKRFIIKKLNVAIFLLLCVLREG